MNFSKPAETPENLYELLRKRGLEIEDREKFIQYVNHIGYYRLTGYMYPFHSNDGNHTFKEGIIFSKVLNYYIFDKKLRFFYL